VPPAREKTKVTSGHRVKVPLTSRLVIVPTVPLLIIDADVGIAPMPMLCICWKPGRTYGAFNFCWATAV
jgi:hypothetical protein